VAWVTYRTITRFDLDANDFDHQMHKACAERSTGRRRPLVEGSGGPLDPVDPLRRRRSGQVP
jgi:hypothetical protein